MSSNTNFATWNGVVKPSYTDFEHGNTKSNGNTATDAAGANSSMAMNSGKWYAEFYLTVNTTYPMVGLSPGASAGDNRPFLSTSGYLSPLRYKPGASAGSRLEDNTAIFSPNGFGTITRTQTNVDSAVTGDIIGFALDVDNRKLWISKNGTFFNSGDPAAGSNEQYSWASNPQDIFFNCTTYVTNRAVHANFGQDSTFAGAVSAGGNTDSNGFGDFKYAPPTGFLALCSANLPISDDIDPAQTDDDFPQKNFNTVIFNGNGSSNAVTGLGFQPDLIWGFTRDGSQSKRMVDSTRGGSERLYSDLGSAASTGTATISAFGTDGFTATGGAFNNDSGKACGAWCWRANAGTTSSNTNGSITSTVQANQAAGFSIITYTGTGSNATIGHGLSSAPDFFMTKDRGRAENWAVYHSSRGATKYLTLNTNSSEYANSNRWNDTEPTSTVFSLGTNDNVNGSSANYVAYAWHSVDGYSKFGIYTGNGNANGPFMYTGFRPRMVFLKRIDGSHNWVTFDTATVTFNPDDEYANWDTGSTSAQSASDKIDILSNGWKLRSTGSSFNNSGSTFIYGAWGDVPFKYNNTF